MRAATEPDSEVVTSPPEGMYATDALAEIIGVPPDRIFQWVSQELLEPAHACASVLYFDFAQMSAAQTLRDLSASGASLAKLRREMKRLRRWLPAQAAAPPLVPAGGAMHVRLRADELAEPDGQLRLEFDDVAASGPIAMNASPVTASGWFARGCANEADGQLDAAIADYRQALRVGGPDAKIAYALAHALAAAGRHESAAERYLQVTELDPQNGDAWNNLGTVLCAMELRDEACAAFRQALEVNPNDARARYNLADTLDELGRGAEAVPHYRHYLQHDSTSTWAAHARRRIAAV